MGTSSTPLYSPSFRIWYLGFDGFPIDKSKAEVVVEKAVARTQPWRVYRKRDLDTIAGQPAARYDLTYVREVSPGTHVSHEFMLSLLTKVKPSQLNALERYRQDLANAIRDHAPHGLWNINVETRLTSGEPFAAYAANSQELFAASR